ncbi:MAG: Smr/MutS family protein [Myxococcaceae bacterium]
MAHINDRELFLRAVNDPSLIAYKSEPIPKSQRQKKRPQKDYEASLDLHGLTADKAIARVKAFLLGCVERQKKRVLIIHGKGSGVLRYEVRSYLGASDLVAQVKDAPTKLGGEGAVLVLLRAATARHV